MRITELHLRAVSNLASRSTAIVSCDCFFTIIIYTIINDIVIIQLRFTDRYNNIYYTEDRLIYIRWCWVRELSVGRRLRGEREWKKKEKIYYNGDGMKKKASLGNLKLLVCTFYVGAPRRIGRKSEGLILHTRIIYIGTYTIVETL